MECKHCSCPAALTDIDRIELNRRNEEAKRPSPVCDASSVVVRPATPLQATPLHARHVVYKPRVQVHPPSLRDGTYCTVHQKNGTERNGTDNVHRPVLIGCTGSSVETRKRSDRVLSATHRPQASMWCLKHVSVRRTEWNGTERPSSGPHRLHWIDCVDRASIVMKGVLVVTVA
jgi:hypothetical protein